MRLKSALFALPLSLLLLAPHATFADSLTLTGTGGGSTDGVDTFPYIFNVTVGGTTTDGVDLSCLSFNREVTIEETWSVNATDLQNFSGTIDGSSSKALDEDAYLVSLYNTGFDGASNSEIQFAIWSILDPGQINTNWGNPYDNSGAFDSKAQALASLAVTFANNNADTAAFYGQFTLFTPTTSQTGWTDGEPQQFLEYTPSTTPQTPVAPTPEPSSLMLLGTGLLGTVAAMRRKLQKA